MTDSLQSDELVRSQYDAFPYPELLTDLESRARKGIVQICDPSVFSVQLWPEGRPKQDLNILIAGCGPNQAAIIAYANRGCNVVAIDVSQSSLDHEQYLKNKYSLSNLRLACMDLREVERLGNKFDLIKCTGVLHHMELPMEGLKALASVLSAEGVLHGLVYASNRRVGVYLLQDVFHRLGLRQGVKDIHLARELIGFLPPHHYFNWFRRVDTTNEFAKDAAFVDLLLHPRDRAFAVPELLGLIGGAGLAFQEWEDNQFYFADTHFGSESKVATILRELPEVDQWAIMDNLLLQVPHHSFLACHPQQRDKRVIGFAGDTLLDSFPLRRPGLQLTRDGENYGLTRGSPKLRLSKAEHFFIQMSDGTRSVREIVAHRALASHPEHNLLEFAREFYRRMWQRGHVFLSRVRL